jgi:8-oxo-dGTP pyrophosphatase MutT (NUDIX family)
MHYIQSYILDKLTVAKSLRNKDMRPPKVESNLYQYHLLQLLKEGYVKKVEKVYSLDKKGLAYAGRHSATLKKVRPQPQVITILFVRNSAGELFIRVKQRQPFIGMKSIIIGKVHLGETIDAAARREFYERACTDLTDVTFTPFGSAHVVITQDDCVLSDYVGQLIEVTVPDSIHMLTGEFMHVDVIDSLPLSPGVHELIDAYKTQAIFTEIHTEYIPN